MACMRRIALLLLFSALPLTAAPRVVLVSVDGGGDVTLDRLLASGVLKGGAFETMKRRGVVAASMTPGAISSTPVSHPTIFTGTWPETHGITGVGILGDDISGDLRSGFAVPTSVPRLWTVAQQAGKRVVCIAAPGAEGTSPESTCTETAPFNAISRAGDAAVAGDDLMSRIRQALGPSPGSAAGQPATTGQITEEEFVAREEHFADYLGGAVRLQLARTDWDLLIVYIPLIDGLAHRYQLEDRRQVEYDDEKGARRRRFAGFIERGYRKTDAILKSWLTASPETNFVVVSDHGMIPTHSVVLLNNALAAAGLRVGGADPEVRAISSGASAQVYVNSKRRFARGTVADEDVAAVVAKVVTALRALRDPVTGRAVFRTVAAGAEIAALNLQHANAGDVFASAEPGWGITGRFDPAVPVIVPNTLSPDARARVSRSAEERQFLEKGGHNELSAGVHGHLPGDPRTQAIFFAAGPDVPRRKVGTVEMIDVAPTVLRMLGVARPSFMTGRAVW
jgi:predicted AlkP superfamily pyrophosphatase or phosphodiesterase